MLIKFPILPQISRWRLWPQSARARLRRRNRPGLCDGQHIRQPRHQLTPAHWTACVCRNAGEFHRRYSALHFCTKVPKLLSVQSFAIVLRARRRYKLGKVFLWIMFYDYLKFLKKKKKCELSSLVVILNLVQNICFLFNRATSIVSACSAIVRERESTRASLRTASRASSSRNGKLLNL